MAAITWEDVQSVAPELAGDVVQPIAQEAILAVANSQLDPTTWGGETSDKLRAGRIYYAAHLATLGRLRGRAGMVSSESAGGLSRSYANPLLGYKTTLVLTSYGILYMGLAKTTAARAGITLGTGGLGPSDPGWDG